MKVGDKVTYVPTAYPKAKMEIGRIKEIHSKDYVFVVYNCDGNWLKYRHYTAQLTRTDCLVLGWRDIEGEE